MKFMISRSELGNLIKKIQNVVPQNAPIPILSHFLIEAKGNELVFTATDLTVGARCTTEAKVFEEGSLSIPSRRFFQLVRELTDAQIEVAAHAGEMAEIRSGTSQFRLNGMDKSEYPALPDLAEATRFTISRETLFEMFHRTSFAVSKEESRYVLTGVLMRIASGKAIFVGTDGKRLAKTEAPVPLPHDFAGDYILPLKAVEEALKMLAQGEDEATVYLTDDKVAIEVGSLLLITKLLSDNYPDFQQVIASQSSLSLSLHREELLTLLRQISLFTSDLSDSVRFTFVPGEVILRANSADIGEGKVSMPVNFEGERVDIAFNPHYFLDILRHTKDETVELGISDSFNPGIITDSTESLFIIMPMRLSDDA